MILHSLACHCIVSYGVAGYCIVGFGARAVSRKTPTYFIRRCSFWSLHLPSPSAWVRSLGFLSESCSRRMQGDHDDVYCVVICSDYHILRGEMNSITCNISTTMIFITTTTMIIITTTITMITTTTMIFPGLWPPASPPSVASPQYSLQTLASSSLLTPSKGH